MKQILLNTSKMFTKKLSILGVLMLSLVLVGCQYGSDESTEKSTNELTSTIKAMITTDSGLQYFIGKEGSGTAAKSGDQVSVHYVGTLLDGSKFDSSRDRNAPFEFSLGGGQVIKGWDEGVQGMKVGETRTLTVPADLAYGGFSPSDKIPANSVLEFEIELLEIK
jgi:FKBP-type peptidyl-prolyl cis-trans isomerase